MGFRQSPFPMIDGTTGHKKELTSPAKQKPHLGLKRAKRPKKKDTVKTIQIPEKHIVQGKKNPVGGPVLKSPGEGGPKPGTGVIWNKEEMKKMKEHFTSPMKQKSSPAKGYKKDAKAYSAGLDTSAPKLGVTTATESAEKRFGKSGEVTHKMPPSPPGETTA